jgi:hypothetical protein
MQTRALEDTITHILGIHVLYKARKISTGSIVYSDTINVCAGGSEEFLNKKRAHKVEIIFKRL